MKNRWIVSVAAALASGQLSAADSDAVVDTVIALDDVEIVANRANSKTPVAYTNVGRRELQKVNDGRDIPYLLSMTPSLITTSDAGGGVGYTSLRVRGSDGSRINVMAEKNLILIRGSVPGPKDSLLTIKTTVKNKKTVKR